MHTMLARRALKLFARIPLGEVRECLLCSRRFGRFLPYRGGWRAAPPLLSALAVVGSDLDHYQCPACGCNDRERHLWAYFRALRLIEELKGKALLHFAPEPMLTGLLRNAGLAQHTLGDLHPTASQVERIDMLDIPYADETFDMVMANHVLEHVTDDLRALAELHRVLKPGGSAILQTPYSAVLAQTLYDPAVTTAEARLHLYGQEDHVRLYGRDFVARVASTGFSPKIRTHDDVLAGFDSRRYGVNPREPLLLFQRA